MTTFCPVRHLESSERGGRREEERKGGEKERQEIHVNYTERILWTFFL